MLPVMLITIMNPDAWIMIGTWLPYQKLQTEAYCVEYYVTQTPERTKMEIWIRLIDHLLLENTGFVNLCN